MAPITLKVLRIVAMVVFAGSFFLPAVVDKNGGESVLRGWQCAYFSLSFLVSAVRDLFHASGRKEWSGLLVGMTGLINPLLFAYLAIRNAPWKRVLAGAIALLGCIALPIALHFLHFDAIWGCYLWLGAILVLLLPEVLRSKRAETPSDSVEAPRSVQDLHNGG